MSDHSITSLIEKLEQAEVGSRELDALVVAELQGNGFKATGTHVSGHGAFFSPDRVTTSLDAALALAERLELSVGEILNDALEGPAGVGLWQSGWNGTVSTIPQIARFVCIAILRAQSEARV